MSTDTGFVPGSITEVMTATLLVQCVERGLVDFDARVTMFLPELRLAAPAHAEQLRARRRLKHTNGIDGNFFWPDSFFWTDSVKGRDALRAMLFEPGARLNLSPDEIPTFGGVTRDLSQEPLHGPVPHAVDQGPGGADDRLLPAARRPA
jgi:CubicO group peptidase (beta-lactamase class C family)